MALFTSSNTTMDGNSQQITLQRESRHITLISATNGFYVTFDPNATSVDNTAALWPAGVPLIYEGVTPLSKLFIKSSTAGGTLSCIAH